MERSTVSILWGTFQCQNTRSGLPSISNREALKVCEQEVAALPHIIQWSWIAVTCRFTGCRAICQCEMFAFLHLLCFIQLNAWGLESQFQTPQGTPVCALLPPRKSPRLKPLARKGGTLLLLRVFPAEVYFLFPGRLLEEPEGKGWRFPELFQRWAQSFSSFEHNCFGNEWGVGHSTQLWALIWTAGSFDECGPEPALGIIKALFLHHKVWLVP